MEKHDRLYQSIMVAALITVPILLVPIVAMQFTEEVVWTLSDFTIMGSIIFCAGLSFKLIIERSPSILYRIGIGMAIGTALLMVWANLAVGLIGSGPNIGNFMYLGVLGVGIAGAWRAHFQPRGMERAMYVTALALGVLAIVALLLGMQRSSGSTALEIIGINAFFAALFSVAGVLFRFAKENHAG